MTLHGCRHWNATELLGNGIGANTVSDRLGHVSPAFTLAVYGHSDQERDRPGRFDHRGRPARLTARP